MLFTEFLVYYLFLPFPCFITLLLRSIFITLRPTLSFIVNSLWHLILPIMTCPLCLCFITRPLFPFFNTSWASCFSVFSNSHFLCVFVFSRLFCASLLSYLLHVYFLMSSLCPCALSCLLWFSFIFPFLYSAFACLLLQFLFS